MKKKSNILFITVGILLLAGIGIAIEQQNKHTIKSETRPNSGLQEKILTADNTALQVEIAETPQQQKTGLSHREQLKEGRGMLFVFNTDGSHPIWMKDMRFPIDIVWLDEMMTVVHIEQSIEPETYPRSFASPVPARYVLEVPAGYTNRRISINDTLLLEE